MIYGPDRDTFESERTTGVNQNIWAGSKVGSPQTQLG